MMAPNSDGAPQQERRHQDVSQPTTGYTLPEIVDPRSCSHMAALGADLIAQAARDRASREVTEAGASFAEADDVMRSFLSLVVRDIFVRAGVMGVRQ